MCVCLCQSLWGVSRGWLKGNESFSSLKQTHKHLSVQQRTINQHNAFSHEDYLFLSLFFFFWRDVVFAGMSSFAAHIYHAALNLFLVVI